MVASEADAGERVDRDEVGTMSRACSAATPKLKRKPNVFVVAINDASKWIALKRCGVGLHMTAE